MIKRGYFYFLVLGIIVGGIVGIISINTLLSYRMDLYIEEIRNLRLNLEEKDDQVEKLNESINLKKFIVKELEIHIECKDKNNDELFKIEMQKKIKDSVKTIIGKEVRKIDMEMLWDVLDNRVIEINKVNYSLKVKKLLVSEKAIIWIEVKNKQRI